MQLEVSDNENRQSNSQQTVTQKIYCAPTRFGITSFTLMVFNEQVKSEQ